MNFEKWVAEAEAKKTTPHNAEESWILSTLYDGLRPEQDMTVSEWADRYRVLSGVASSEPGQWRTERFPFLREIMDSLSSNSNYETVVFQKGAQVGATESGNNWIGYVIHQAPGPMLMVLPTVDMAKDNSKTRLDPLIEESPALRDRVKEPRSRDSGNTMLMKEFSGGFIALIGANSPSAMRSKPIRYLFIDEVDSAPSDVGNEGDFVGLLRARTRTFSRRKIFMASTPTIKGKSRIERAYTETDQRKYFVPCPKCHFKQPLEWKQIKWANNDPKTAHYECINCGEKIYNHDKNWMLSNGEWRPTSVSKDSRHIGFHLSSLYSPVGFYSWEDAVGEWISAKHNTQALKTFINTVLGETWEEKGDAPEWERLFARRENYQIGTIPKNGVLLVAGADVQQDRIEIEIVAYGQDKQSFSIEYLVFMGDPSQPEIWANLDDLLSRTWTHESGVNIGLMGLAIDSGYSSSHVYNWTRKKSKNRVFAVKGQDSLKTIYSNVKILDIRLDNGKRIDRGARLWNVGVSVIKTELYDFLRQERPDSGNNYPYGYCHFPEYSEEYFRQLTAEHLISINKKNGGIQYEWHKLRERNEALDCRVYARAAAALLGMDRWNNKNWNDLRESLGIIETEKRAEPDPIIEKKIIRKRRVYSAGLN
jgi:phage terminase large subunit GpA-like protein